MNFDIKNFINIVETFEKNNARIKELDSTINFKNAAGLDSKELISEINQLYSINNELQTDLKNLNLNVNDQAFNMEKYVELNKKLELNNASLDSLDHLINMRNALGHDSSNYIAEYNEILKENEKIRSDFSLYNVNLSQDKANLIYDRYVSKQKIYTFAKEISENIGNNFEKVVELITEAKKEIESYNTIEIQLEKQCNEEKYGILSEKRNKERRLSELKELVREKNLQIQTLMPGTYEYSKCKSIINDLEKDIKLTTENLEQISNKENNLINLDNIDKPLAKKDEENLKESSLNDEQKESTHPNLKDYKMNGSKLDNIEKYGVDFRPKEIRPINVEEATPTLKEKAKNISKIFSKIKNSSHEKISNLADKISSYMEENITYGRSR